MRTGAKSPHCSTVCFLQLDLRREAANLERFRSDFADDPELVFPRPLYPWVTENVLVEEFKVRDSR